MSEAPKVYCRKEKKKVPIWYCLGSFIQQRVPCSYWTGKATVKMRDNFAEVECSFEVTET